MLESGQELSARFVLVRRLGTGGSGEVWLAQDRERGCFVALKVLRENLGAIAALQRECEHVRALDHPNVLRVDDVHRTATHTWISMEYASGGDLSQLRGRSYLEIVRATLPIAAALAHAHRAGIIHRDVKPSNVLLASDGTPRLADFGTALVTAAMPAANAGRGSPYSMSPQQAAGAPASAADDLYGFGAMLYELLSGYPPSYGDGKRAAGTGKSFAALPASVPEPLALLVTWRLAESPAARPADMESVERTLAAVLAAPHVAPLEPVNPSAPSPTPIQIEPPGLRAPAQGEPLR